MDIIFLFAPNLGSATFNRGGHFAKSEEKNTKQTKIDETNEKIINFSFVSYPPFASDIADHG
jgi:hypothetical protein